jgi:hypothetical protein
MLSTKAWGSGGMMETEGLLFVLSTLKSMLLLVFWVARGGVGFGASRFATPEFSPFPDDPDAV